MNVADLLPSAAPEGKYGKSPFGSCCAMVFAGGGSRMRRRYMRCTSLFIPTVFPVTIFNLFTNTYMNHLSCMLQKNSIHVYASTKQCI